MRPMTSHAERGVTLVEVLVTMVILAIGLLCFLTSRRRANFQWRPDRFGEWEARYARPQPARR